MKNPGDSYQVLARKYRPQTFDEVLGQASTAKTLMNAIEANRVAHAYIFCGPRGVGKTSMARIFAKALNCQDGPSISPCNACEICDSVSTGEDLDIIEIDGASNRGVDEARAIRDNVKYAPSRARYKIYIIDEAHMLTTEAFNALLKTLEEPPTHVKFFLATTDPSKLPDTIRSRCQKFEFRRVPADLIHTRLSKIAANEGCSIEDGALALVTRAAGGSVRDSQSLLDQLIAYGGGKVTTEDVRELLGLIPVETIGEILKTFGSGDSRQPLSVLHEAVGQGHDPADLVSQTLELLRGVMLYHSCGPDHPALAEHQVELGVVADCAQSITLPTVLTALQILSETKRKIAFLGESRLLFEMSLVRLARQRSVRDLDEILVELKALRSRHPDVAGPASLSTPGGAGRTIVRPQHPSTRSRNPSDSSGEAPIPRSRPKQSEPFEPKEGGDRSPRAEKTGSSVTMERPEPAPDAVPSTVAVSEPQDVRVTGSDDEVWSAAVEVVRARSMTVGSFLADATLVRVENDEIVLAFGSRQVFHKKMIDAAEERKLIEQDIARVFGRAMRLVLEKDENESKDSGPRLGDDSKNAERDPVAKAVLDRFGGRVIKYEREK